MKPNTFPWLSCLVALGLVACVLPACKNPTPPAPKVGYVLNWTEITNGVAVLFSSKPSAELDARLRMNGATSTNGLWFDLPAVDTDARRNALNAALASGATLPGRKP